MTIAKAIAAFITSFVTLLAVLGFNTGTWVTPDLVEVISSLLAAFIPGFFTWLIPNKPA